jgi:apolipoprotein N-acyltransferase
MILIAVALSAAAYFLSTGLGEVWVAAWIAPIPILWLAFQSRRRTAALAAAAAFFLGSLNLFGYLARIAPIPIVVVALAIPALAFASAVLAARYVVHRAPPWAAVFAFPAAWTTYEFLLSQVSPHGTSLSLAYSQTDLLPLLQLASLTGLWGITFLVTMIPSALAVAWTSRSPRVLILPAAIVIAVLTCGALRLQHPLTGPATRVGLAATDQLPPETFATEDAGQALNVARRYTEMVRQLAAKGAQVVVLPEKLVGVTPADSDAVLEVFRGAAQAVQITLIVGLNRVGIEPLRNVAVVIGPDGGILKEYDKHHMLPGPETGYAVGQKPAVFAEGWGVAICKDMDFPDWSRGYGRREVRILAVPAWDFVVDARLHSRMAVVRSVENGFSMARSAREGSLTLTDGYGRITAEAASNGSADSLLLGNLKPGPGPTLYTWLGDWFGWMSVVLLAVLLAMPGKASQRAIPKRLPPTVPLRYPGTSNSL